SNADGSRRTFANGNAGSATYLMLNAGTWPEGTYHIAVQAISPDGIGSAWSKETSFENHLVSPAFTASVNELSTADTLHIAPIYAREGANYQYNLQPDGRIVSQNADGSADISFESFGQKTVTLSLDGHTFTQGVQVVPFRTETNEDGYSGNVFDLNQDGWAEGFSERFYTNTQGTFKELMKSFNTDLNISHGGYVVDFNRDGRPDIYS
ncbi:FG-GAP repeat domain-containing protein, partial [Paraprevotella xylaniphila]